MIDELSRLRMPVGAGLQGVAPESAEGARANLDEYLASEAFNELPEDVRSVIEAHAAAALARMGAGEALDTPERIGLEALVRTTGRPALAVRDGSLDLNDSEAKTWKAQLTEFMPLIARALPSIGRIDLNGALVGTGFVVSDGLVLTNRHVLEVLAKAFRQNGRETWILRAGQPSIDFIREKGATQRRRFRILEVVAAGPDAINNRINFRNLDAALLRISDADEQGREAPRPLAMLDAESLDYEEPLDVAVIGYPGPARFAPQGPSPTAQEAEVMAALSRIFRAEYGVKRVSPGRIIQPLRQVPDDDKRWVMAHDATTLGGASGAAVIRLFGEDPVVVGLHFGGQLLAANWAHAAAALNAPLLRGSGGVYRWAR